MSAAIPPLDAHELMRSAGWEPLEPYPACAIPMYSPWRCECTTCGRERLMTISAAVDGERCPYCWPRARRGSGPRRPGITRRLARRIGLGAAAALVVAACGTDLPDALPMPGEPGQTYEVLAWGLSSPRGLAVDANGAVYVSEAGWGGEECVNPKDGPCFGFGGAIHRYSHLGTSNPERQTVASGIVSMAFLRPDGPEVLGIAGIDLTDEGELVGTMLFSPPGVRDRLGPADAPHTPSPGLDAAIEAYAGRVVTLDGNGSLRGVVDVGSVNYAWAKENKDAEWAPTGQFPDANPYAVLAEGGRMWVADAGANSISEIVTEGGKPVPRLISYVPAPAPGMSSVPTCIARSGDWLYVGTLDFAGNFAGSEPTSKVYRINVSSTDPFASAEVWAEGFNPITGCAVIDDHLYVSEYMTKATNYEFGAVVRVRIEPNGSAGARKTMGTDLVHPAGIAALGRSIIVVNHSVARAGAGPDEPGGQIVRLIG